LGCWLQSLLQVPVLANLGFLPKIAWTPRHPGVQKILKLMLPSIYGSAVYQLNILAITFMASFLTTGAVSWLWYADRVMEFPLGVFAISFATVILPQLSDHAAVQDLSNFKKTFQEGLRMIYFVNLPAMVGLVVLAEPIISVLFQHGNFSVHSTQMTAQALQCFALGLPFVSGARISSSAFYALQDSKRPVRAANLAVLVNILVGASLIKFLGHRGLALGVGSGSFFNFVFQMTDLRKKMGCLCIKKRLGVLSKIVAASAVMGVALYFAVPWVKGFFGDSSIQRLMALVALIVLGVFLYFVSALALRIEELNPLLRTVKRKIFRKKR